MKSLIVGCLSIVLGILVYTWTQVGSALGQAELSVLRAPTVVAADSSGSENHGIISGNPVLGLPGRRGSAYSFDRPGSWVQVPSSTSLNPGSADFRFSAWVVLDEKVRPRETYDLLRKGHADTPTGEYKLEIVPPGHVRCTAKDYSQRSVRVTNRAIDVTDGAWHRVGCARTGTVWSAYVDGNIASEKAALGAVGNTYPLAIGSKYGLDDAPRGRLDHVKLTIGRYSRREDAMPASGVVGALRELAGERPTGVWRLDEAAVSRDPAG